MGKRRFRRLKYKEPEPPEEKEVVEEKPVKENYTGFLKFYNEQYKTLLFIPLIILLLAFGQIGLQISSTGDFISKGVSLKGGATITLAYEGDVDALEGQLRAQYPDIAFKQLRGVGGTNVIIESPMTDQGEIRLFSGVIEDITGVPSSEYVTEVTGPTLSEQFFADTIVAIIVGFLFMALVVFFYFATDRNAKIVALVGTVVAVIFVQMTNQVAHFLAVILAVGLGYIYYKYSIPSLAVILSAVSDIVVTIAVVNLMGMRISTAGIAAFLMLIGYSVDTDILLSNKVLKRKEGSIFSRQIGAGKTGLTMSATTIVAIGLGLFFSQSDVISQIMTILLIGLIVDLMNTWILNAGLLRWFLERGK